MYFYLILNNYIKLGPYERFQAMFENSSNQKREFPIETGLIKISTF